MSSDYTMADSFIRSCVGLIHEMLEATGTRHQVLEVFMVP